MMVRTLSMSKLNLFLLFILIAGGLFITPLQAELLLYYDFDIEAGTLVFDLSGNGFHGTMEYGFPRDSTALPEYIDSFDTAHGKAMLFGYDNGVPGEGWNDIDVVKDPNLAYIGQNWSMAFWARQDDNVLDWSGGWARIISCPNYEIELGASTDTVTYFWPYDADPAYPDPTSWDFSMAPSPDLGEWFHMIVTYDGTTFRQYIDGVEVFTRTGMGPFVESTWFESGFYNDTTLRIAAQCNINQRYLVGALDDVAIWNETISSGDIPSVISGEYFLPYKDNAQVPEASPASLLFNPTFIYEYSANQLAAEEAWMPHTPWNWSVDKEADPNNYGIRNVSLWDGGDPSVVKYAAFIPDGDLLFQQPFEGGAWTPAKEGVEYNLRVRLAGDNAVDDTVGVKFYVFSMDEPNNLTLIADLNAFITEDRIWHELSSQFIADADSHNKYFMAEAYITRGTGNPADTAYGYFDEIVVSVEGAVNCEGVKNLGLLNSADFNENCSVEVEDFKVFIGQWQEGAGLEPITSETELLDNPDFYADLGRISELGSSDGGAPAGWSFVPETTDPAVAGIWNLADVGKVNSIETGDYQAAGGSVVVYIDPNTILQQTAATAIEEGTTYYLSAMVAGVETSYQNIVRITWEYVDDPQSPSSVTEVATREFVLADQALWRKLTAEFTADSAAAGNYLRARAEYEKTEISASVGWGLIGYLSIDTVKPYAWPRTNLLVNGDLEDVSNLSQEDQFKLLATYYDYTLHSNGTPGEWPPGWTYEWVLGSSNGLQCMLWAPPPQPVQGRVSIWMDAGVSITQKVTTETIQSGKTYYLDFVGTVSWSEYNNGHEPWPVPDPNMVAELYWVAPGQNGLSGEKGTDWDYITKAEAIADGSLGAMGGHWQTGTAEYTADSTTAGKNFFVKVGGSDPYVTIEEIFLSDEPRPEIGPYTCYEQTDKFGSIETDMNNDCRIDLMDFSLFAEEWLNCSDPEGCL